jgi:hypothetical protein
MGLPISVSFAPADETGLDMHMKTLSQSLLILLLALHVMEVRAMDFTYTLPPPAWGNVIRQTAMNPMNFQSTVRPGASRQFNSDDPKTSSTAQHAVAPTTLQSALVAPAMPGKIAASYPESFRREAERVFRELLTGYGKIEQQFGIPKHDVAGSVAAFVAGSYMAYRNVDFPDEHFKPLVAQMRQIIGSNPDFAKASNAEKQEMYEQMAILGMFMATTQMALKEKPNPQISANVRQAAKGYMEQFLKTDADRVQITAQGLVLR